MRSSRAAGERWSTLSSRVCALRRRTIGAIALASGWGALLVVAPAVVADWGHAHSGGFGHQVLRGGPKADYLRGDEGPDTVRGNGGADLLTGDTGPDRVFGGAGGDTIVGGSGNDALSGGPGDDVISGGFGADGLDGGPGSDALDGGNDTDTLSGGDGDDVLHGGSGADRLSGGAGDDRIFADSGADEIAAGPGDDVVVVDGSAFAHVSCGPGRDVLYIAVAADAVADYAGAAIRTQYASDCETVRLTTALDDPNKGITYLAPDEGATRAGSARDDILLGGPGPDTLRGGAGNDVLWGLRQPGLQSFAPDVLQGGAGDDTIYGGPGRQRISGGAGDDFIESGIGDGTIDAGSGDDTIRLRGGGLTTIDAGSGNDTIYAQGPARANVHCGPGRDVVHADPGDKVGRDCERRIGSSARARTRSTYADAVGTTSGLVHWWRLGEAPGISSGTYTLADRVGGATATYYGQLGVPGVVDDGDTAFASPSYEPYEGYVSLGIPDELLHGQFTFEAWFRPDDAGHARVLLNNTSNGTVDGVVLVREADGSLRATISSSTDSAHVEVRTAPLDLVPGSWHHIALTRADDRVAIYVDGRVAAQASATPVKIVYETYNVAVGLRYGAYGGWVGGIDEIALYDRPLDADTILAHADAGDDGTPPVARADPPLPAQPLPRATVVNLTTGRAGSSFRCAFDGGDYVPCPPAVPLSGLADGAHELRVLATSRVGVSQSTPTVLRFDLDATVPGTVLVVRLSPDGDGRAIASFGSSGATRFECLTSFGVPQLDSGWLPCRAPLDVPRGATFAARAVNAVGNADPTPASVYVPASGRFTGTPAIRTFAGATAEAQIAGEPLAAGSYQCRLDGGEWSACPATVRLPILDSGPHAFQVRESVLGALATTAPLIWDVAARGGLSIAGMQAPLVIERDGQLRRRGPSVRFALSAPATVSVDVLRRAGRRAIRVTKAGRTGSNVIRIPGRTLHALHSGRYTLRLVARASGKAVTTQLLPLALVPSLR